MESSNIPWHPAFIEAIQLELEAYRDSLEFYPEYQLTTEPLRIDCIIIKKSKDTVIEKNIAAMFREVNLLEYKSPGDYVSIKDFYKVYSYACLYASLEEYPITNITLSFIESRYPKALLKHLKNVRGYKVEERSPGVYTVKGDILPIQLIDNRKLSWEENLWLKGLSNQLDSLAIIRISDEAVKKDIRIQAYMNAIAKANFLAIEEAKNMSTAAKSLEEVFVRTGWAAEWEAKGEERKAIDIAQNMVDLGFPLGAIVSATRLGIEKVEKLFQKESSG